jgi:hypothetical protein
MHWKVKFIDETEIEQYPNDREDNTLKLKEIMSNQETIKSFCLIADGAEQASLELKSKQFILGNLIIPLMIKEPKLVYFMTREGVGNGIDFFEAPRTHTLGVEDKNGKMFFNIREDGIVFLSNCNP